MTLLVEANHISHFDHPASHETGAACQCRQSDTIGNRCSTALHFLRSQFGTAARRSAVAFRIQSKSSVLVAFVWGRSCTGTYGGARPRPAKSNDVFVRALTKLSVLADLLLLPRLYGRSRRPQRSAPSLEKMSAPALAGSPANSNLPASCLPPSSLRSPGATRRRPF